MRTVDVIIPLYKPGKELFTLVERLNKQTLRPAKIILCNTEEKYFEQLTYGTAFPQKYGEWISVYHISKREFDHGKTRHLATLKSWAECFVMMTQDALPADEYVIENLIKALDNPDVAVAYARQLPSEDCNFIERYTRQFNYPDASIVKSKKDLERLGIKTYFCSNVCAAYQRDAYDKMGGFVRHTIFNEDMIFAAGAINSGFKIFYAADAKVIHSHNYTGRQQLKRNFDLGVSQAEHPEVFENVPSEKEGKKMVKEVIAYLKKEHKIHLIPGYIYQCGCRFIGYKLGKHYRVLPKFFVKWCSSNPYYFMK